MAPTDWRTDSLDPGTFDALARGLPATRLWSLLLRVGETRAAERSAAALVQQWHEDRFVAPSYLDQRAQLEIDRILLEAARDFEALELSPLAPLGACSTVAATTQNRIVSTMRGTELVADPTNVLALESARRLSVAPQTVVKLATNHRCVRAQALPKRLGLAAHFKMFAMTSAGHELKDQAFTVGALNEHIGIHLRACARLAQAGYPLGPLRLTVLATKAREHLASRIAAGLHEASVEHKSLEHDYYDGLRFMLDSQHPSGEWIGLSDGGAFDWLAKICSNHKLVFVASAMGTQRIPVAFVRSTVTP